MNESLGIVLAFLFLGAVIAALVLIPKRIAARQVERDAAEADRQIRREAQEKLQQRARRTTAGQLILNFVRRSGYNDGSAEARRKVLLVSGRLRGRTTDVLGDALGALVGRVPGAENAAVAVGARGVPPLMRVPLPDLDTDEITATTSGSRNPIAIDVAWALANDADQAVLLLQFENAGLVAAHGDTVNHYSWSRIAYPNGPTFDGLVDIFRALFPDWAASVSSDATETDLLNARILFMARLLIEDEAFLENNASSMTWLGV